ncbi:MAG: gliding motility-associated C-terminal domain-containing protein [Saprospiraceae bacterium]|nr:gliding motility-associated C-terminal domain-containing protein [Saprospiraceae bacterium]
MHKFLILLVVCFIGTAALVHAQVPQVISVAPFQFDPTAVSLTPDAPCNAAGTFTLGPFVGQSNDTSLDTIYLCEGDQISIVHNGDFNLAGDPVPATPPGIAWAFYTCKPTVAGDSYQTLLANEPCFLIGSTGNPVFAFGQPNGNITFLNNGLLQSTFNGGQPVSFFFAPITVDNFDPNQTYESSIVGAPPGPCVNVNIAAAFQVVYLNAIKESGVSNNFGNDCLGKFRISGGLPQWSSSARYTIDISLASDPAVKALIHNSSSQIGNNADVFFSVSQPGIYTVTIEDGKSCGHTFQINMSGCNPSDNATIAQPDTISPPNSQICIPLTVQNFQVVGASFSINWDPTILEYNGIQNPSDSIGSVFDLNNLNIQLTNQGKLGFVIYNQSDLGKVINIPNGNTLVEVCFNVIGPLGSCSPLTVTSSPTGVNIENATGNTVALTAIPGQVCVDFLPLTISAEVINPTCFGDASIRVMATGGTASYDVIIRSLGTGPTYSGNILTAGASFTRTGVQSGSWEVCVTDANNVEVCDTLVVDVPIIGASLENTKRPTCFSLTDGIVTAIVSLNGSAVPNPGPNFTFTWSPPNPAGNVPVFNNASAGVYSVTVTETNSGCTAFATGTLDQPQNLIIPNANLLITPTTCSGVNDGAITLTPLGGTPFPGMEYLYNWEYVCNVSDPPAQWSSGQSSTVQIDGLNDCTYFVTITDANGCTVNREIDVTTARNVDLQVTSTTPIFTNCFGDNTGSICVRVVETPASATPNYSFFWQPIGFQQNTVSPTESCYDDLPAGIYRVLAIDAIGCLDTITVEVFSPEAFFLDTTVYQIPTCAFQNNGSLTVQGFGGNGFPNGYTYLWSTGASGSSIANLSPGDYSVTATDLNGCVDSLFFTLELPPPPVITQVDSLPVKCGSDGSITVTSPTGVTYTWQTLDGQPVGNTATISGLPGDTYIVTIMDNQGCTTSDTFTLAPVTPMSFSDTSFTEPACFGYSDGIISVGVMDGNPAYQYLWSADSLGQGTSTLINIPAGDYTVTVTDLEGCTLVGTFTLGQPPEIIVTFGTPMPTSCFGVCDGSVIPTVTYADGTTADFNFVWSDGGLDSMRNNLCADTVNVIAIDPNNCFGTDTIIIPGPPAVAFDTLYTIPTTCFGGDDGQAIVNGAGGNGGPFTYIWESGSTSSTATGLVAQEYNVTITDNNGCTGVFTAEVGQPDEIIVLQNGAETENVKCFGGDDGRLGVIVTGGNPGGYTYQWVDQDSMTVGNMQNEGGLKAGVYAVTVTDPKGCTGVLQNMVITDPPPVQGQYLPLESLLCFGDETTLFIDTIFGGSGGPYQFSVDFGVLLPPSFPVSIGGGEHFITYYDRFNCEFTEVINVQEPAPILVEFNPPTWEIELGDTLYQLKPIISGPALDTFVWSPADLLRNPFDLRPYVNSFNNQTYTLTVFDANGCSGTGSILIEVDPNRNVYVPNVFKPGNTGGENDFFYPIVGLGVEKVNYMRVYDRWGTLMYERNDFYPNPDVLAQGWDGRYRGQYVNPAVFVYVMEVKFLDGKVLTYRGDVTVVR